jgi:hypothetical protein
VPKWRTDEGRFASLIGSPALDRFVSFVASCENGLEVFFASFAPLREKLAE